MKKSYKGAIAASAAGVLLLGGAGSLAYWTATGDVPGGTITSGELKLTEQDCGDWLLDGGGVFTPGTNLLVPGDSLTRTCDYTIVATGDHLEADLTVDQPTVTSGTLPVTASGAYTVNGASTTEISDANDGQTLSATVTVEFDEGLTADNTSQNVSATLSAFTVTATQNHS